MKQIFSCLRKTGGKIAKYLVFSLFFAASLFLGSNLVSAADDYSNYDNYDADHPFVATNTNPNGTLASSCSNASFTIVSSSYTGKNSAGSATSTGCVSFTSATSSSVVIDDVSYTINRNGDGKIVLRNGTTTYTATSNTAISVGGSAYTIGADGSGNLTFASGGTTYTAVKSSYNYIQGQTSNATPSTWNKITFTTNNISTKYNFIIVAEYGHSKSDTKTDYDLYRWDATSSKYVYSQIRNKVTTAEPDRASYPGTASYASNTYTFTYYLRNSDFKEHQIEVYFYNAEPDTNEPTHNVDIKYILAKPISDYKFNVDKTDTKDANNTTLTDTCKLNEYDVCINYVSNYNTGANDNGTKTNTFTITFSKDAAFYFSTVKSHGYESDDITSALVRTYNSIYATNTFFNEGYSAAADAIVYDYFYFVDSSEYDEGVTTLDHYQFTLTIDANGTYRFFMTDIFKNFLSPETHNDDDDSPVINDVSNRKLTIYYLVYTFDGDGNITAVYNHGDNVDSAVLNFQLLNDANALENTLTNENVTIGLEFYSKVEINKDYGVTSQDSKKEILLNPLYYEGQNAGTTTNSQLRIYEEDDSTQDKLSYFCRQKSATDADCITTGSNYTLKELLGNQFIAATTDGLKQVNNTFNPNDNKYYTGMLSSLASISDNTRANRTNLVLNENGVFFVRIQDIYGNSTSSTISVSIIDQHNPVITVNGATTAGASAITLDNTICSSMYVVGAGGTIATYPNAVLSYDTGCTGNSVLYNHFASVEASGETTEKKDDIRANFVLTRTTSTIEQTAGFYNTATNLVSFNYADAIRMSLLRVSDSVVIADADKTEIEKSYYEKTDATYTGYALYTRNRGDNTTTGASKVAYTDITGSLTRTNYGYSLNNGEEIAGSDLIIANNYTQYSSELKNFDSDTTKDEFVVFDVYAIEAGGSPSATAACNSITDAANNVCNDIVNTFIDKGINFVLEFQAQDYVGNVSHKIRVKITIKDDTTPGIVSISTQGEVNTDPTIATNNIDTTCRLEIGSYIQTKTQLLECYGLLSASTYNFADNATGYLSLTASSGYNASNYISKTYTTPYSHTDRVYKYTLSDQLFLTNSAEDDSYYKNIKVYVCLTAGKDKCTNNWVEITDSVAEEDRTKFENAGSYEIKFEITDVGHKYIAGQTHTKNKTTIIFCYYVNPRVLLVRPIEKTVTYGGYNSQLGNGEGGLNIDYCVYATTNTNAFFKNLFALNYNPNATDYYDTYDFVDKNYETSQYGLVYCTKYNGSDVAQGSNAATSTLATVLASDKADIKGSLGITYATGTNKYDMELNTYNAYQDAGYYYITMGDLSIGALDEDDTNTYSQNYVLRLHPSYLLDGKDPNDKLVNYDAESIKAEEQYKYGTNVNSHGETISNVLFTVEQAKLTITANGGSKTYGNPDTNYPQASNTNAIINVSQYTDKTANVSTAGYLNGFTITGLIENDWVKDFSNTTGTGGNPRYNAIIQGYLRRELGEKAGKYYICNNNNPDNIDSTCNLNGFTQISATEVELKMGENVYALNGANYTLTDATHTLRYGMYVAIDGEYYKLTRDNTNLTTKKFTNTVITTTWKFNYNDSTYSVVILVNDNNANQNYYIEYVEAMYTINPGKLIVQPGSNQGKEYSNPQHNDPLYEIIIFGETRDITKTAYGSTFEGENGGFTETIANVTYPSAPTKDDEPYKNGGSYTPDQQLYFDERRTTTKDIFKDTTFVYKFADVTLSASNTFDWMGTNYTYTSNKICLTSSKIGSSYTQCEGMNIGIYNVAVSGNTVTITTNGKLTYQNYELLAAKVGTESVAGKANIVRDDLNNINVGWYSYVFTNANMHVIQNGKEFCTVDTNYQYTVNGGSSACSNYNLTWDDNAPVNTVSDGKVTVSTTTEGTGGNYAHNGSVYCNVVGETGYSYGCGENVTTIKFSIFKRDIILSFNAYNVVYGNVYSFFTNSGGIFNIPNETSTTPEYSGHSNATDKRILTCYQKLSTGTYIAKNGHKYAPLESCDSVDHGISSSDYWGGDTGNGLNLLFSLDPDIQNYFKESNYPIPAGLYYVFATIGTYDSATQTYVHPNYNLVYIDFNIIQKTTGVELEKNGAVEITSKEIELVGTYYQKEYGQGKYNSYGSNGEALTSSGTNGSGAYSATLSKTKEDAVNKIFDNHYYHCEGSTGSYGVVNGTISNVATLTYGCLGLNNTDDIEIKGVNHANYGYGNTNNIFGYTSSGMVNLADGYADEIYTNFIGTPVRKDLNNTTDNLEDPYGLLADVGYYSIDLSGITAVVAQYRDFTAGFDPLTTIRRYTNYKITSTKPGRLYITPASINIETTQGQTKMYGCAYNTFNNTSVYNYTYGEGYTNCIESNGALYDLGYQYVVSNDKYNYLMSKVSLDTENNINVLEYEAANDGIGVTLCALASRNTGTTCQDIVYPTSADAGYGDYTYTVSPNFNNAATATQTATRKPTNTALNEGVLFRIPITIENSAYSVEYDYKKYFDYATNAQLTGTGRVYQNQTVGDYALTLGNLDSKFNNNTMCDLTSVPNSTTSTSKCKNFIINYNNNNTSLHTYTTSDQFSEDTFVLNLTREIFTITTRNVVLNTEYNYKIYGDTDPVEGFTCANLSSMFGLANYTGRSYCEDSNTFIETGVTRYYAVDNSLAKAPWTGWTKDAIDGATSYNTYNDILFDVVDSATSRIHRVGQTAAAANPTNNAARYDAGGKYHYIYDMHLNTLNSNNTNYVINYIEFNTSVKDSTSEVVTSRDNDNLVYGADVGFAIVDDDELERWYGNAKHKCHSVKDKGGNNSATCDAYTGVETYNFYIDGIASKAAGTYADAITYVVGENESIIISEVYFEIIQREIYIQTLPVNKDYGNEEDYLDFTLKLVTPGDTPGTYVDITFSQEWGDPHSLSKDDYDTFFPSGTFNLAKFTGSANANGYNDRNTSNRAFGIYYYRTYGENIGTYTIVACATQFSGDDTCRTYYDTESNFASVEGATLDAKKLATVGQFIVPDDRGSSNNYNASNYIVYTIPSTLTISKRGLDITPDSNQGFQYGNFITGTLIDPITYTESYTHNVDGTSVTEQGLVNGGILNNADHVNNQIAICIYDIEGVITCINDRQNSKAGTIVGYVTTKLHAAAGYEPSATSGILTTAPDYRTLLGYNVYNDDYTKDNDETNVENAYERYALNRELSGNANQRYNRNVGTYVIKRGELLDNRYCRENSVTTNCLDDNYKVLTVNETVEYKITPANIVVTPKVDQKKTYGTVDVEIAFDVETTFIYKSNIIDETYNPKFDRYHCNKGTCQSQSGFGSYASSSEDETTKIVTIKINGFAYSENVIEANGTNIEADHNYGISRVSNKSATEKKILSTFTATNVNAPSDKSSYPKYYDKYCYGVNASVEACTKFTSSVRYSYLTYEDTSRILLGYFYVDGYDQRAKSTTIRNGIVVALNEFGLANYSYLVGMDAETAVQFTVNKLKVDATINNVTKVYGQATDSHKADAYTHMCGVGVTEANCIGDHSVVMTEENSNDSLNNENRLEYNFNVVDATGSGVTSVNGTDLVILTPLIDNHYYTQTGLAETKNVHLGLSVVREQGTSCLINDDKYGCEDAGTYKLVFRKIPVTNDVDKNYDVTYDGAVKSVADNKTGYVHVNTTTTTRNETEGIAAGNVTYTVYSDTISYIDKIDATAERNASAPYVYNEISIIDEYSATLTIKKRNVEFYVGTYESDGVVAERYIIEQNEEVPEFPILNAPFTTSTTSVKSKETYFTTWYDTNEYGKTVTNATLTYAARQVRTADNVITTLTGDPNRLGVGICKVKSSNIQSEVYGSGNCSASNFIQFNVSNNIDADGAYVFDTMEVGDYAIVRDPARTYITYSGRELTQEYENKNYTTDDYNGTLVIYEDQTAPIISIGNGEFAIEANAHTVTSSGCVVNTAGGAYSYSCDVAGLRFIEEDKKLGDIIKYITNNYSDYGNTTNVSRNAYSITEATKVSFRLPESLPADMSSWIYQPVNNIGNTTVATTQYKVDRSVNTYAFTTEDSVGLIDSRLEAISSIVSFFNINSYDYGYVRNGRPIDKRYTPRYYFFIDKDVNGKLATFDPTYVGDFRLYVYAIDNVGNLAQVEVTLKITDTTKPVTSEAYVFNVPVVCNDNGTGICTTNDINNWYVAEGYVPINAFTRYDNSGVNDVNGTRIKVASSTGGQLVDINTIKRYRRVDVDTYEEYVLGEYVKVEAPTADSHIKALEVEHKYWYNSEKLYLVVVDGMDNSYIDPSDADTLSQWHTYYTVDNGSNWYKYDRHATSGTEIVFKDGITKLYTRIMDTGRKFEKATTANESTYYNNMYLSSKLCNDLDNGFFNGNCTNMNATQDITQVKNLKMTDKEDGTYEFKVNALMLTYNPSANTVVWVGQSEPETVESGVFDYGIMKCTITVENSEYIVNCQTTYKLVYGANDKKQVDKVSYTLTNSYNVNDPDDALEFDETTGATTRLYYDRRYIYIDTVAPEIESLNGDPFSLYEYYLTCQKDNHDDEDRCSTSYKEEFLHATDSKVTTTAAAVVTGEPTTLALGDVTAYENIALFTGKIFISDTNTTAMAGLTSFTNKSSGLLTDSSIIMNGSEEYNNGNSAVAFNKHDITLIVYLVAKVGGVTTNYRFTAMYTGERFKVHRDESPYSVITTFTDIVPNTYANANMDSIEEVLEFIVSTESISLSGAHLDFSINYVLNDAAGNNSVSVANLTVRGVTYIRYESTVTFNTTNTPVNLTVTGNNSYAISVNQGASLVDALEGFVLSNRDYDGNNHMTNMKQSLYYNGEVLFENVDYDANVIEFVNSLATAPGAYTLKFTNSREIVVDGEVRTIDDIPLELTINVTPTVANVSRANNYTFVILALISMILAPIAIMGIGMSKKKKKAE